MQPAAINLPCTRSSNCTPNAGGPDPIWEQTFNRLVARIDAERSHTLALRAIDLAPLAGRPLVTLPASLQTDALGLTFASPLLLAAGFDKNAAHIDGLLALGFGAVEVGTVTALPQPGNRRPRLFRLPQDRAIVNRMGFNNDGAEAVAGRLAARLRRRRREIHGVVGVNIGKSKATPARRAAADYHRSATLLAPYADYLVINVSSPNTPGLRDLQATDELQPLITAVRSALARVGRADLPLLVKIAPDLHDENLDAIATLAVRESLAGLIATNTTIARERLHSPATIVAAAGAGGLSGPPLRDRAEAVLLRLATKLAASDVILIAAGGVTSALDVRRRLQLGATLVQAYTGFVYGGPLWPRTVARQLAAGIS